MERRRRRNGEAWVVAALWWAQTATAQAPAGDVVVLGRRGQALRTDVAPLLHLDAAMMRATGATSIADLVKRLGTRTQGVDGTPPLLAIDGRRPLGDEIDTLPFEAFASTDLLPPEAATKLGFPPTQPVINLVTKPRFRAVIVNSFGTSATDGGTNTGLAEGTVTRLRDKRRLTLGLTLTGQGALRQNRRGLGADPASPFSGVGNIFAADGGPIDPRLDALVGRPVTAAAVPRNPTARGTLAGYAATANQARADDDGDDRTLRPHQDGAKASLFLTRPLGQHVALSTSLSADRQHSWSLTGPATAAITISAANPFSPFSGDVVLDRSLAEVAPLRQHGTTLVLHGGVGLAGSAAGWAWSLLSGVDRRQAQSSSDLAVETGPVQAAVAAGADPFRGFAPALLTAREVERSRATITTLDAQVIASGRPIELPAGRADVTLTLTGQRAATRTTTRSLTETSVALGRTTGGVLVATTLPIASRLDDVLPALGQLSVTFTAGVTGVSRFGALANTSYGTAWTPVHRLQLLATVRDSAAPPLLDRVATPTSTIASLPFFDLVTGQSRLVAATSGGNPALRAEHRHDLSLAVNLQPLRDDRFRLTATYQATSIRNQTATLSTVTPLIASAFPERVTRDAAGQLTAVDFRPVNFARETQRTLGGTASFGGQVGGKRPGSPAGPPTTAPFFVLSVSPRLRLADRLLLHAGTPELDLLRGDVLAARGGPPRWEVQTDMFLSYKGVGGYLQPTWREGSRARAEAAAADLRFSGLTAIDLGGYINFDDATKAHWARGLSVSAGFNNLLNDRVRVRDRLGRTPYGDQPAFLDPVGRVVTASIRKRF